MDDGGLNVKRMARSKRASSQRSKAKHSKHHSGAGAGAGVGASAPGSRQNFVQEALPSNWERYEEGSGSDDPDAKPGFEGQVRPKSKGADYAEILSSEAPKLYEDPPRPEGMVALLLSNGLGLTDWDSSYLEPASSSDWKAAQEASALLHLDLGLLGKSLSRLHVSERLFLEEDLFPKQEPAEAEGDLNTTLGLAADVTSFERRTERDSAGSIKDPLEKPESPLAKSPTSGAPVVNKRNIAPVPSPRHRNANQYRPASPNHASVFSKRNSETGASLQDSGVAHESSSIRANKVGFTSEMGKGTPAEEVSMSRAFEATAAEAELDELLDMLDSHVAGVPLKVEKEVEVQRPPPAGSHLAAHGPPKPSPKKPVVDFRPLEPAKKVPLVDGPVGLPPASSSSTTAQSQKHVPPSQDEDFDEWLDSL